MPEPSAGNATSKKLEPTQIQVSPRIFTDLERASTILYCLTSKFGSLRQKALKSSASTSASSSSSSGSSGCEPSERA